MRMMILPFQDLFTGIRSLAELSKKFSLSHKILSIMFIPLHFKLFFYTCIKLISRIVSRLGFPSFFSHEAKMLKRLNVLNLEAVVIFESSDGGVVNFLCTNFAISRSFCHIAAELFRPFRFKLLNCTKKIL